jgi:opacity protein-like surface antigen
MSIDLNNADPLMSLGALYGYGITPEITVEGELNLGLVGGEYKQKNAAGDVFEEGDYRIWTLAGYGVYRFPLSDVAYIKGKLGLLFENVKRSGELEDDSATGFGLAGGIGAGTQVIEGLTLEAEITGIDEDIIFYSLGLHYAFK